MINKLDKTKIYKLLFKKGVTLHPLSWLGWLIRLIAKVEYNHTGVLYFEEGVWKLQEAIDKGVISTPFIDSNAYHYYTHYSIEEFKGVTGRANLIHIHLIEGKKYDYKGLLFYQLWLNLFNKWLGKAANDGDKYYCYESVAYVFNINEKKPNDINKHFFVIYENTL